MLSPDHRAIVKATVPLLEAGGEALTTHFYRLLLVEQPDLRGMFNQSHQASGQQARALATGILKYAKHIDQLEALGGLAARIVNKHVSLQVKPEHYPIVGRYLLRSIREVLGEEIATDAVIEAWGAAYGQLADILIDAEKAMYLAQEDAQGGWSGLRRFRVADKVIESDEITSFYLRPEDGGPVMDFLPGQYIGLQIILDGEAMRRNYSLSAAPNGSSYRISVKREVGGLVSGYLHGSVKKGDILDLTAPAGAFALRSSERPAVLISGGVGQTPLLAMLEALMSTKRDVHYVHFARRPGVHAFRAHVNALAGRNPRLKYFYAYESADNSAPAVHAAGRVSREILREFLPANNDFDAYIVGPYPFMASVRSILADFGIPAEQCSSECFGPDQALEAQK